MAQGHKITDSPFKDAKEVLYPHRFDEPTDTQ